MNAPKARIGSAAELTIVGSAKCGVGSMARILPLPDSMPDVRIPELAAATELNIKDIYRVLKNRRVGGDQAAFKTGRSKAVIKLRATEAIAVAASLRAAPKLAVDRAKLAGEFFNYLQSKPEGRMVEIDTDLFVDAAKATTKIVEMIAAFNDKKSLIDCDPAICGGGPVYKGSSISVHNIAKRLALGDTVEDIQADLPRLREDAILAAPQLAAAHPLRGRPRQNLRAPIGTGMSLEGLISALKGRAKSNTSEN